MVGLVRTLVELVVILAGLGLEVAVPANSLIVVMTSQAISAVNIHSCVIGPCSLYLTLNSLALTSLSLAPLTLNSLALSPAPLTSSLELNLTTNHPSPGDPLLPSLVTRHLLLAPDLL